MMQEKVTGKTQIWLTSGYDIDSYLRAKTDESRLASLAIASRDMSDHGWLLVGEATVSFTAPTRDMLRNRQVGAIKAMIEKEKAESYMRLVGLEDKLNQLLAITCEVSE